MSEVLYILFGFVLAFIPGWLDRKRRIQTHWRAIRAEMVLIREKAVVLLNDGVQAPLYRFPLHSYQVAYPLLLSEGAVEEEEIKAIGRCFSQVEDINRGLDNAAELYKSRDERIDTEHRRNRLKANTLLGKDGLASLYDPAFLIVEEKIKKQLWKY